MELPSYSSSSSNSPPEYSTLVELKHKNKPYVCSYSLNRSDIYIDISYHLPNIGELPENVEYKMEIPSSVLEILYNHQVSPYSEVYEYSIYYIFGDIRLDPPVTVDHFVHHHPIVKIPLRIIKEITDLDMIIRIRPICSSLHILRDFMYFIQPNPGKNLEFNKLYDEFKLWCEIYQVDMPERRHFMRILSTKYEVNEKYVYNARMIF